MSRAWRNNPERLEEAAERFRRMNKEPKFLEAQRDRMRRRWQDPEFRLKTSQAISKARREGAYGSPTSLEIELFREIEDLGWELVQFYQPPGCLFEYDAFVPDLNVLVEADGDYWHYSSRAVEGGSLEKMKEKDKWATDRGFVIIRVRESEAKKKGMLTCLLEKYPGLDPISYAKALNSS